MRLLQYMLGLGGGLLYALAIFVASGFLATSLEMPVEDLDVSAGPPHTIQAGMVAWLGWVLGSVICGGFIRLAMQRKCHALTHMAGAILTCAAIAGFMWFPTPPWLVVLGLLTFIPCTLLGHALASRMAWA